MLAANYVTIPDGASGTAETLRLMRRLVRSEKRNMVIRSLAEQLIAGLPQKSAYREVAALHAYVRDQIRFTRDITGTENLVVPSTLVFSRQGDCASKATLLAALLESIGYSTRFFAVARAPGEYEHVWAEVLLGTPTAQNWIPLEATEPWPMGRKVNPLEFPAPPMVVTN